jgi:hypothetical protein
VKTPSVIATSRAVGETIGRIDQVAPPPAAEQGRSAYRLYQVLADHLRHALPATAAYQLFARFLIEHIPPLPAGTATGRAHPYTRRHLEEEHGKPYPRCILGA